MRTVIIADSSIGSANRNPYYEQYYEDPETELWGLNMTVSGTNYWDRWFEIHADYIVDAPPSYLWFLAKDHGTKPIYMMRVEKGVPSSVRFPLAEVCEGVSNAYFVTTRSYMIALAIYENFERIVVIGSGEIEPERSNRSLRNVAYWLGVAAGRGIDVIADPREGAMVNYAGDVRHNLYGYRLPMEAAVDPERIDAIRKSIEELRRAAQAAGTFVVDEDTAMAR